VVRIVVLEQFGMFHVPASAAATAIGGGVDRLQAQNPNTAAASTAPSARCGRVSGPSSTPALSPVHMARTSDSRCMTLLKITPSTCRTTSASQALASTSCTSSNASLPPTSFKVR
jgi:hypothetical protein